MELNRPQVDVGLFTNRINEMKALYGETLGLQFESELAVGGGFKQHRAGRDRNRPARSRQASIFAIWLSNRKGEETANRWASWVGPVSRIAASFEPRGVNAKPVAISQKTPLRVKRNCIVGNQCERSGLSPKLFCNPFDRVVACFEALFLRHPSRRSPEYGDRRYRAPKSIDQLPDITPCGRA
jgi:hypothetical protein